MGAGQGRQLAFSGVWIELMEGEAAREGRAAPEPRRLSELRGRKPEPDGAVLERAFRVIAALRYGDLSEPVVERIGRDVGVILARGDLGPLNWGGRGTLALLDFLLDPCPQTADELVRFVSCFARVAERRLADRAITDPLLTLRDCFGFTQREVARLLGPSPSTIRRWNKKRSGVGFRALKRLAECGWWLREAGLGPRQARLWLEEPLEELQGASPRRYLSRFGPASVWVIAGQAHALYCRRRADRRGPQRAVFCPQRPTFSP